MVVPTPNLSRADYGAEVMNRSGPSLSSLPPRNYCCMAWAVRAAEFLGPARGHRAFPLVSWPDGAAEEDRRRP